MAAILPRTKCVNRSSHFDDNNIQHLVVQIYEFNYVPMCSTVKYAINDVMLKTL